MGGAHVWAGEETTHPPSEVFAARAARVLHLDDDPWWTGPVGWLFEDVVEIEPVPCRGAQRLWTVPPEVEHVVRLRVAMASRSARPSQNL